MSLPDEAIREFKELHEKNYGVKLSDLEAREAAENLYGLFDLLIKADRVEKQHQLRLKSEPKGFHVEGSYSCPLCKRGMANENTWYDKHGLKCITCQKALDKRLIPASVLKNNDTWYSMHDFDYYFGIRSQSIRKLVRDGVLKSRVVPGPEKRAHFELFLIKDNPDVLGRKPRSYTIQNDDGSFSIGYEEVKLPDVLEKLRSK